MGDFFYNLAHGLAEEACGTKLLEKARDILLGTGIDGATDLMQSGYEIMVGISAALITLYFLMELVGQVQQAQNHTPEMILKVLIKVVIAVELIVHGFDLFITLRQVGDSLTSSLSGITSASAGGMSVADQVVPAGEKWYFYLGTTIELLIPWVLSKILYLGINVTCYARIIELVIRTIFAPIPLADIFNGGLHSPGVRYIKKYLGVCLQGAAILCILSVTATISSNALMGIDGDNYIWATLAVNFAGLMAILKSQSIANDIAGA